MLECLGLIRLLLIHAYSIFHTGSTTTGCKMARVDRESSTTIQSEISITVVMSNSMIQEVPSSTCIILHVVICT
jgi:hypothetical protein